jgi:hypothetical protein
VTLAEKSALAAAFLVLVGLFLASLGGYMGMMQRIDNDRRAMIAAREGNCKEAWHRYHSSGGLSGETVEFYCPRNPR